jgi:hypothetical protein
MKMFNILSRDEKNELLKFPAYISILAANRDGELDKAEKLEAMRLTDIKTYAGDPLLINFYKEAEDAFFKNITEIDKSLPEGKEERENSIRAELLKLEPILNKLGVEFAQTMHESMTSYTKHVSNAHKSVLVSFLFPFYIKGLST